MDNMKQTGSLSYPTDNLTNYYWIKECSLWLTDYWNSTADKSSNIQNKNLSEK